MPLDGFAGFGFTTPEMVQQQMQAGLSRAVQSGNVNALRTGIAQNAANLVVAPEALRVARKKKEVITTALDSVKETGDAIADQMAQLRAIQRGAVDADLPEIALQATQQLGTLTIQEEERARLKENDEIRDFAFEEAKRESEEDIADRQFTQRNSANEAGLRAYRSGIDNGLTEEQAELAGARARIASLASMTDRGDIQAGAELAEELGFEPSRFKADEVSAQIGENRAPALKQVVITENAAGEPEISFAVQGPDGPELIETGVSAGARAGSAGSGGSGKITDAQRKNAAFAFNMTQSNSTIEELSFDGKDFTGLKDTLESKLPNRLTPQERQRFESSKEAFINAKLRRESGATIKDEEYMRAEKALFPQPGDKIENVLMKADLRRAEWAGIRAAAGDAAYANVESAYLRAQEDSRLRELDQRGL